jgi:hypothetical protein
VNILVNPGFETGDFTGWQNLSHVDTSICDTSDPGYAPGFADVYSSPVYPVHTGTYSAGVGGCIGAIKQSFSQVFPTEISFWVFSDANPGAPNYIQAYIFYADGTVVDSCDAVTSFGCPVSGSVWTQYVLSFDSAKAVIGIEVTHELTGAHGNFFDDFAVLVPATIPTPEFNPSLSSLLIVAPALVLIMALRRRMIGANKNAPMTETN